MKGDPFEWKKTRDRINDFVAEFKKNHQKHGWSFHLYDPHYDPMLLQVLDLPGFDTGQDLDVE